MVIITILVSRAKMVAINIISVLLKDKLRKTSKTIKLLNAKNLY